MKMLIERLMILVASTQRHQLMFSDQSPGHLVNESSMNRNPRPLFYFAGVSKLSQKGMLLPLNTAKVFNISCINDI